MNIKIIIKRSAIFLVMLFLLPSCMTAIYSNHAAPPFFPELLGVWDELPNSQEFCVDNKHQSRIEISPERQWLIFYKLVPQQKGNGKVVDSLRYKIIYHDQTSLTLYLENESRTNSFGDKMLWQLVIEAPDTYTWRKYGAHPSWRSQVIGKKCSE